MEQLKKTDITAQRSPSLAVLLTISDAEKVRRYEAMVRATFSHVNGRDLLGELHPRSTLDIKRRADGVDTWFEGDWLSTLRNSRDGREFRTAP